MFGSTVESTILASQGCFYRDFVKLEIPTSLSPHDSVNFTATPNKH